MKTMVVYSGVDRLPSGRAAGGITEGCMVLEGGAFRGVYTSGVLDALMEAGVNLQCTIGVSAGAMNGINYVSGQIGRSARINLRYRRDPRYVGLHAYRGNRGIIGFDFLFGDYDKLDPLDRGALARNGRRFVAVAANCCTGQTEYFERDNCTDMRKAIQASASMPYVSRPVLVDGVPCLDGGCTDKLPFGWALRSGYQKVVVVRTRPDDYRKTVRERSARWAQRVYREYPAFAKALGECDRNYNRQCDTLERLKRQGRVFVISPSEPVTISRLEKDMEKLGNLYYLGYNDVRRQLDALRAYLA